MKEWEEIKCHIVFLFFLLWIKNTSLLLVCQQVTLNTFFFTSHLHFNTSAVDLSLIWFLMSSQTQPFLSFCFVTFDLYQQIWEDIQPSCTMRLLESLVIKGEKNGEKIKVPFLCLLAQGNPSAGLLLLTRSGKHNLELLAVSQKCFSFGVMWWNVYHWDKLVKDKVWTIDEILLLAAFVCFPLAEAGGLQEYFADPNQQPDNKTDPEISFFVIKA